MALAAVTPPFDGFTVNVDELESDESMWTVGIDIRPGLSQGRFATSLDARRVAWWAVDDLGQYYLGDLGSYSGSADSATGTLEFTLALDRRATRLTLLPSGPTERARIEFPLPRSGT